MNKKAQATFGDFALKTYAMLKPVTDKYKNYFKDIELDLKRAEMPYTLEEYFSLAVFAGIVGFVGSLVGVTVFVTLLTSDILISIIFACLIAVFVGTGAISLFYFYPTQVVAGRKKKIDNSLHFATIYMSTLAGTGVPPYLIFSIMSRFKDLGEIAIVASRIWRDIDTFGLDLVEAITRAASRSPSEKLRELFFGIKATITSGGDLKKYLIEKSKGYTTAYRRSLQEYVKTLSIFMEMYITVVIVGSIFAVILTTIMSLVGGSMGDIKIIQMVLVTVGLPFASAAFVVLLKTIAP
ncbi:MAG: type II secretion system F family protein [Candidatus Nanoarchaeia archaeon]|nr:type II secretion system F family protein [Candidatus Nanoarchaeia archaeon]